MSLLRSLLAPPPARASMTIDQVGEMFRAGGYVFGQTWSSAPEREEPWDADYLGLLNHIFRANPIAFAAIVVRMQVFSQARFRFRRYTDGEPDEMFGTVALGPLEKPEPSMVTSDLLARAELDASLAGNWFAIRRPDRIKRVRPDWCYLVRASRYADDPAGALSVDAELVGLVYQPGGPYSSHAPQTFAVEEFAHYAPIPDPSASYRGMSWLTTILADVEMDRAATAHKAAFFRNAGTPNMVVKYPAGVPLAKAQEWIELFEQEHSGTFNAYRTAYLGAGADLEVVGKDLQQLDMKAIQGASETRISVASRVPAVLLGISEGLAGSSLNTGNYNSAKRNFADTVMRHDWGNMAASLETIVVPPKGAHLVIDEAQIQFLADDAKDAAEVLNLKASAMRTLWDAGADPASVIDAITSGNLRRVKHTGNLSVQLQPGGIDPDEDASDVTPPVLAHEVRCTGLRKDGRACGAMLGRRAGPEPVGFERKCERCDTVSVL